MIDRISLFLSVICLLGLLLLGTAQTQAALVISPAQVVLSGPESSQQLLVTEGARQLKSVDLTRLATFKIANPALARVNQNGLVEPLAEGQTEILVTHEGQSTRVPLTVSGLNEPAPISFTRDVIPVLTKSSCNMGACHGKAEGKNGFKLSVFGFAPVADHDALVKEGRGRRVRIATPEQSLLLLKGTAAVPHGGGMKLEKNSIGYRRLVRWIGEGAHFEVEESSPTVSIEIEPTQQVLLAGGTQQIRVTAIDANGRRRCVTVESQFESNVPAIADVDSHGLVEASDIPGEAAILARYAGHVAVCRVTLPRPGVKFARPPENNFIDGLVWDKLERLGIEPSGLADDGEFLRRVYLDTIGTLPTVEEARAFLESTEKDKRARLIDALLARDEYADFWTLRWADLLRADKMEMTAEGTVAITRWLHRQFRENRPYDEFAYDVVTAQGNVLGESPAGFYKVLGKPDVMSRSVSQLFLGVRIECAQCHHHPAEKWTQEDYTGFTGFFTGVKSKKLPNKTDAIVSVGGVDQNHPRTGEVVPARALAAEPADFTSVGDRRVSLARWMTSPENPFFARAISNRLWSHYFGRGLVEQIDDMRETNPASNEPLLQALADHLIKVDYDLKAFTRTLLNSRVYQLSAATNDTNESDSQNFSHAAYKSMAAEVLLDAICQSTGVPEKFNGWPEGYRAIEIWDNRMPSYFFRIFGRPVRATVCECERSNEPSISQALHLLNSPEITEKIHHRHGVARNLAQSNRTPAEIVDDLYLGTLSRFPTDKERALMLGAFGNENENRQQATEDVMWALLNSKDFIYNH